MDEFKNNLKKISFIENGNVFKTSISEVRFNDVSADLFINGKYIDTFLDYDVFYQKYKQQLITFSSNIQLPVNNIERKSKLNKSADLPIMALRNEIRYLIQELRKTLQINVSDVWKCYVEILSDTNRFTLFCSVDKKYPDYRDNTKPMTNIDYLKQHCILNNLIINLNGHCYNGKYSVDDRRLLKLKGNLIKTASVDINYNTDSYQVLINIYDQKY